MIWLDKCQKINIYLWNVIPLDLFWRVRRFVQPQAEHDSGIAVVVSRTNVASAVLLRFATG